MLSMILGVCFVVSQPIFLRSLDPKSNICRARLFSIVGIRIPRSAQNPRSATMQSRANLFHSPASNGAPWQVLGLSPPYLSALLAQRAQHLAAPCRDQSLALIEL